MSRRLTWDDRLSQFRKRHGSFYEYEQPSTLPKSLTKINIKCPVHGWFSQTIKKHAAGQGCKECGIIRRGEKGRLTQERFIERSMKAHGGFYTYEKSVYSGSDKPITITCPEHGDFVTTPATHMDGHKCPKCALAASAYSQEAIIEQFKEQHGDLYNYDYVEYTGLRNPVKIICSIHGAFYQQPANHKRGSKCPYCSGIQVHWPTYVAKCHKTHAGKYTYPEQELKNVGQKITIICPVHGKFRQIASEHQYKYGCPECGGTKKLTNNEVIDRFKKKHGDRFDYSLVQYVASTIPVKIICKDHGVFHQSPAAHYNGHIGCKLCTSKVSREETMLASYISQIVGTENVRRSARNIIPPQELDIVIPSQKIAIEYNGLYWHSDMQRELKYHMNKTNLCNAAGYRLIHVWQDDWVHKRHIVKSFLSSVLIGEQARVFARKTVFEELLDKKVVQEFLDKNHIQGRCGFTKAFGLTHHGKLVSVATVINRSDTDWELNRCCSIVGTQIIGALGKLTKNISRILRVNLYSFCDISMFTGQSYVAAGYKLDCRIRPDYRYIIDGVRKHKFNYRRSKLRKFLGAGYNKGDSEVINMRNNGYYRIFDCGKLKYVYNTL